MRCCVVWQHPAAACSCKATLQVLACLVKLPGPLPPYDIHPCRSHSPKRLTSPRHAPQRPASAHAGVLQAAAAGGASPSAELPAWDDSPPSALRTLRSLSPQHRLPAGVHPPHRRPPQRLAASAATQQPAGPSVAKKLQRWWQPLAQVHSARLQPDGGDWRQGLREAWMATPHDSVRFQLGNPQPAVAAGPWEQAETRWVLRDGRRLLQGGQGSHLLPASCVRPKGPFLFSVLCQVCVLSWEFSLLWQAVAVLVLG